MNFITQSISIKSIFPTTYLLLALFLSTTSVFANTDRCFHFFVENPSSTEVELKVVAGHCYEGAMPNGQKYFIPAGKKIELGVICRVQGHDCNGDNGSFDLVFAKADHNNNNKVNFNFSNDGSMWTAGINKYDGKLIRQSDGSYIYQTAQPVKVTAGRVVGSWEKVCQGNCQKEIAVTVTNETTKGTTVTKETRKAISLSLEVGMDFTLGAGSVKTKVSSSTQKMNSTAMTNIVMNGISTTHTNKLNYTPQLMKEYKIFAVWQWVGVTTMSDGSRILIRTEEFTCTPDDTTPNYAPGAPEDIRACIGGNNK